MATREIKKNRSKKKINYAKNVLVVFRSNKNILAQVLEPITKKTVFTVTSISASKEGDKMTKSKAVGAEVAKKAKEMGIEELIFDRNGYIYHGRIKAMVDAVRENGIKI